MPKKTQHQRDVERARANRQAAKATVDTYARPDSFPTFTDTIAFAKKGVYSITRIRQIQNQVFAVTIGTGFLVAPNKLMTCSHVLSSIDKTISPKTNPLAFHQDGDVYYLLNKDPLDLDHYYRLHSKLGSNVHLYPQVDTAILTLDDDFYTNGRKIFQHKDIYLKPLTEARDLGTEVAVLGFPEEKDDVRKLAGVYIDKTTDELKDELIKKRVDRGVINARYKNNDDVICYDFTMQFNPGNSGGPIIDDHGNLVAIVHGYKAFSVKTIEETFIKKNPNGTQTTQTLPATLKAVYSIGFSAENFKAILTEHKIA